MSERSRHKRLLVIAGTLFLLLFSSTALAAETFTIELKSMSGDFITKGYAIIEMAAVLKKNDSPISGVPVSWQVISVANRSEALPGPGKNRIDGLCWEHPYTFGEKIGIFTAITDSTGISLAKLTDIVGERSVTVIATAEHAGIKHQAEQTVVFGNGPLSIFAAPLPEPVTWLELYEICNGEPYPGNPAEWQVGIGSVGSNKIPSLEQMQSISMRSKYNSSQAAFAAAVAAGWPTDKRYWTGKAVMKGRASHMDILNGTQHGSGGNDVNAKEYGVCLR